MLLPAFTVKQDFCITVYDLKWIEAQYWYLIYVIKEIQHEIGFIEKMRTTWDKQVRTTGNPAFRSFVISEKDDIAKFLAEL